MGEATMCWKPIPKGVFDSQRALRILDEVYAAIEAHTAQAVELAEAEARIDENDGWLRGVAGRYPLLADAIPRRNKELEANLPPKPNN